MFSYFYRWDVHNKTCVAVANLQCRISRNWIENQTSLVIDSAHLLTPWLNTEVLLLVFTIECRVVVNMWRSIPISFKTCVFYDVCSLILTEPHTNQIQGSNSEEEPNNALKGHFRTSTWVVLAYDPLSTTTTLVFCIRYWFLWGQVSVYNGGLGNRTKRPVYLLWLTVKCSARKLIVDIYESRITFIFQGLQEHERLCPNSHKRDSRLLLKLEESHAVLVQFFIHDTSSYTPVVLFCIYLWSRTSAVAANSPPSGRYVA